MFSHKRIVAAVAAVVLAGGALAGCGSSSKSGDGDGKVELTFFHRWPNEPKNTYFNQVVAEFEKQNPNITVKTDKVLNDAYKDKIKITVGSKNPPDVFFSWSGSFAAALVKGGNVMDLSDWLAQDKDLAAGFYPNQLPPFQVDGKQYGLPISMDAKLMFYNKKIFAANGITVPKTYDELIAAAKKLKAAGITPIAYGSKDSWTIAHYLGTLNQRIVDPAVTAKDYAGGNPNAFTDPGYVEALKKFSELAQYMNADPNGLTHEQARTNWLGGKSAMAYLEAAEIDYFKDAPTPMDYGTFNFPSVAGGKGDQQELEGAPEGFMISAKTAHPEEAKKFLKFLLSKENGTKWSMDTHEISAIQGATEAADVPAQTKQTAKDVGQAGQMTAWLDNAIDPKLVPVYLSQTQLLLGGQESAEQVMKEVQTAAAGIK